MPVDEYRGAITAVTNSKPCIVTSADHNRAKGDLVKITQVGNMERFNNRKYRIGSTTTNTFSLQDPATREDFDSTDLETYSSGGRWNLISRSDDDRIFYEA